MNACEVFHLSSTSTHAMFSKTYNRGAPQSSHSLSINFVRAPTTPYYLFTFIAQWPTLIIIFTINLLPYMGSGHVVILSLPHLASNFRAFQSAF